jgi:hypothetical protein
MSTQRRRAWRVVVGILGVSVLCSCRDSVRPEDVSSDWPWLTNVSSDRVAVTGAADIAPDEPGALRVKARFINPSADSVSVSHGACAFGLRLRLVNNRALMPVAWENRPQACTMPLFEFRMSGASTRDVNVGVVKPSSFRGVVAAGEYRVSVIWRRHPSPNLLEVSAGSLIVP